jgi:hypothetical protein
MDNVNTESISIKKKYNFNIFPLTKYFYKKGKERWYEPYDHDEIVGYCGPPDEPCIDCYLCFTPICFVFDIGTLCSFQCVK